MSRRFAGRLSFGTAGIRGPLGTGPMRINRVLVRIVAAALAERLLLEHRGESHQAKAPEAELHKTNTPQTDPHEAERHRAEPHEAESCKAEPHETKPHQAETDQTDQHKSETGQSAQLLAEPHVVVGYDARHHSRDFATDMSRVLAARGVRVTMLPEPLPTPVLAFAVKHLGASAGLMITASHNPRDHNGCKVYWQGGAQLATPTDTQISELIDRIPPLTESSLAPQDHPLIATADDGLINAYINAIVGLLDPDGPRSARIAYTPLHGVGGTTFLRALRRAGFVEPSVVTEQAEPDPDFPTAPFPNPEEAGVLELLMRLAKANNADLAIAHDPDADRLAVAVPTNGTWQLLTGDETGCLLADYLLTQNSLEHSQRPGPDSRPNPRQPEPDSKPNHHQLESDSDSEPNRRPPGPYPEPSPRSPGPDLLTCGGETPRRPNHHPPEPDPEPSRRPLVINTVVSSRLLRRIAADHGADWDETLTGFKWIMQAHDLRTASHDLIFAYEDALGYAVGETVRDKDGISAALVMAELASRCADEGRRVNDLLDDLYRRHGVHATGQRSIRFEATSEQLSLRQQAMTALRKFPPELLAGTAVTGIRDFSLGDADETHAGTIAQELSDGGGEGGDIGPAGDFEPHRRRGGSSGGEGGDIGPAGNSVLAPADLLILELERKDGGADRVIVRPSGTEPKIKVYAESVVGVNEHDTTTVKMTGTDTVTVSSDAHEADTVTVLHADVSKTTTVLAHDHVADPGTMASTVTQSVSVIQAMSVTRADADPTEDSDAALLAAKVQGRTRVAALLDDAVRHVAEVERHKRFRFLNEAADQAATTQASRLATATPTGRARADELHLVVRCTDLTTLEGDDTPGRIRALCAQALRPDVADATVGPVAAVCVHPDLVALASELLAGTAVSVASVAGAFPSGLSPLEVRIAEVQAAVAAGADEIDTVLNRSAFLSGHEDIAAAELRALRSAAGQARLKVILEVCELGSSDAVAAATRLAMESGADMVKTSTGKGASGASLDAVLVMAKTVAHHCGSGGDPVGIKVAGGVRSAEEALKYLAIIRSVLGEDWLTPDLCRFGASSLLNNVVAELSTTPN